MQQFSVLLALSGLLSQPSSAAPAPKQTLEEDTIQERQLLGGLLNGVTSTVDDLLNGANAVVSGAVGTIEAVANGNAGQDDPYGTVLDALRPIDRDASPDSVEDAFDGLQKLLTADPPPSNLYGTIGNLVAAGLSPQNIEDNLRFVEGALTGENSVNNNNPRNPSPRAFPKASSRDAPYSLSESQLRSAIHIPSTFQYGRNGAPQPAILVPGTGNTGYATFIGNYIPLLQGSQIADPVWLNIPSFLLQDSQLSGEYVAYAINYIYGISNRRKVAVIGWSQGNINSQWAFKYWPSTRSRTTDLIAFSADYHGTTVANLVAAPGAPLPPSVLQQQRNSNYITTLRRNGGDSAYVPTTNVYSSFLDEIVQPQAGTGASAFLLQNNGVQATNTEVQRVCPQQPAGLFYTHEGVLYNPIGFELLKDALAHSGPGRVDRIDLQSVCNLLLTSGLSATNLLQTENAIVVAGLAIVVYEPKVVTEPRIKGEKSCRLLR
ncbi:hypothetical protein MBLNU230_g1152t2 [Neophaeotheca triangularis]